MRGIAAHSPPKAPADRTGQPSLVKIKERDVLASDICVPSPKPALSQILTHRKSFWCELHSRFPKWNETVIGRYQVKDVIHMGSDLFHRKPEESEFRKVSLAANTAGDGRTKSASARTTKSRAADSAPTVSKIARALLNVNMYMFEF